PRKKNSSPKGPAKLGRQPRRAAERTRPRAGPLVAAGETVCNLADRPCRAKKINVPRVPMPILGAHQSIAGGYFRSVEIASECGCDCVQLFTKNNNQWKAKALTDDDAAKFQSALQTHQITHPLAHDSYLINLAAPDDEMWRKSLEAFAVELLRAEH